MVKVIDDSQKTAQKILNKFPITSVPNEHLYSHEINDYKDYKDLMKVSFNSFPDDFLLENEIDNPNQKINLDNFKYGKLDNHLLAQNTLDEEPNKVWEIVSQKNANVKVNESNIKVESHKELNKNVEYDIYSKILERHTLKSLKGSLYLYNNSRGCFFEIEE